MLQLGKQKTHKNGPEIESHRTSGLMNFHVYFMCLCRDCASHDLCDQPGHGHVLGHLPVDSYGDHGE